MVGQSPLNNEKQDESLSRSALLNSTKSEWLFVAELALGEDHWFTLVLKTQTSQELLNFDGILTGFVLKYASCAASCQLSSGSSRIAKLPPPRFFWKAEFPP